MLQTYLKVDFLSWGRSAPERVNSLTNKWPVGQLESIFLFPRSGLDPMYFF